MPTIGIADALIAIIRDTSGRRLEEAARRRPSSHRRNRDPVAPFNRRHKVNRLPLGEHRAYGSITGRQCIRHGHWNGWIA